MGLLSLLFSCGKSTKKEIVRPVNFGVQLAYTVSPTDFISSVSSLGIFVEKSLPTLRMADCYASREIYESVFNCTVKNHESGNYTQITPPIIPDNLNKIITNMFLIYNADVLKGAKSA